MSLSLEQASGGSFALTAGGLVVATTTSKLKTANTITFVVDGVFKSKVGTDNIAWAAPSTTYVITTPITAGNKCMIGLWLDSAGTFTQTQGPLTPYTVSTDVAAPAPNPGGGRVLVGAAVITAATATFTPGTSAFAVAGTSVNYYDLMSLQSTGLA